MIRFIIFIQDIRIHLSWILFEKQIFNPNIIFSNNQSFDLLFI